MRACKHVAVTGLASKSPLLSSPTSFEFDAVVFYVLLTDCWSQIYMYSERSITPVMCWCKVVRVLCLSTWSCLSQISRNVASQVIRFHQHSIHLVRPAVTVRTTGQMQNGEEYSYSAPSLCWWQVYSAIRKGQEIRAMKWRAILCWPNIIYHALCRKHGKFEIHTNLFRFFCNTWVLALRPSARVR